MLQETFTAAFILFYFTCADGFSDHPALLDW